MTMLTTALKGMLTGTLLLTATLAQAQSVKQELQHKLAQLAPFSADFVQQVTSAEGDSLLTAEGEMQVQRPNKFRWETVSPDPQLIVSDGNSLWFYNPFVEQVSIYTLDDAIANTPFSLIAGADKTAWDSYRVSKQANVYTVVTANDPSAATFTLQFSGDNIAQFSIQEQQGQHSQFTLSNRIDLGKKAGQAFQFNIPANTDIDDQR